MMYIVTLDMKQYDCPFINSSDDLEVSYYMTYWDLKDKDECLVNRGYIIARDPNELQNSIGVLRNQPKFLNLEVLTREKNIAFVRTVIEFTDAMRIIRGNQGYIVGPFFVRKGRELWQVGFDTSYDLDNALSELEKRNEFQVREQNKITVEDFSSVMSNLHLIIKFINSLKELTPVDKKILELSIKYGFFEEPKKICIHDISKCLNVSKGYISRKLRKIERKIMGSAYEIISRQDESPNAPPKTGKTP